MNPLQERLQHIGPGLQEPGGAGVGGGQGQQVSGQQPGVTARRNEHGHGLAARVTDHRVVDRLRHGREAGRRVRYVEALRRERKYKKITERVEFFLLLDTAENIIKQIEVKKLKRRTSSSRE